MFDFNKYHFYTDNKGTVRAVSTYAGKSVVGKATAAPDDTFDLEKGKQLAAARCGLKVAMKRYKRAMAKSNEAMEIVTEANNYLNKMCTYAADAHFELEQAKELLSDLESKM